jgi:endonuclease/exonuclease/phosphatase family metal-dependent hydrolase
MKKGGKKFIVANTHLWWKAEKVMAGSDSARTQQVRNIIAQAEKLRMKYDCPVFFMGDLNCNLRSETLGVALEAGYKPAWEIATVRGDLRCGHHKCDKNGFSRKQNKTDDGFGCIDHFFIFDPHGSVEVKTFVRDYAWFTVKLTDHYPNYADLLLK